MPARPNPSPVVSELARWLVLAAMAVWLLHPFATGRRIGAGDALWYTQMLADFVTQLRAGTFPVFVGGTEWAWNGAVYPLRVAPLFQHLGGLLDLLTGQRLGWYALQHLTVLASGALGLTSAYLCLRVVDRESPWRACVLAGLYLSCPGVLGTIYTQDLYMTWMVLPFLPVALLGVVRTFERDDHAAQLLMAAGLAGTWLAHAPVALWLTLMVGAAQAIRLCTVHRRPASWRRAGVGVVAFALLGAYPFVSVAQLEVPGAAVAMAGNRVDVRQITATLREVFPQVLQPVSEGARALSDLQLGYGLWVAAAIAVALALSPRLSAPANRSARLPLLLLLAGCALLCCLLLPVPILTDWLWAQVPAPVTRLTFYWPMHRFYLLLAAVLAVTLHWAARGASPRVRAAVLGLMAAALAWSLWEARQFVRAGLARTASPEASARALRPENRMLMQHSYGLFESRPPSFSHGVAAPWNEFRLLDPVSGRSMVEAQPADDWKTFAIAPDANPRILSFEPLVDLPPGRRLQLYLRFRTPVTGILQLEGTTFFREYQLPQSGDAAAFGLLPGNATQIAVWTTGPSAERVRIRLIAADESGVPSDRQGYAQFMLREQQDAAPVELVTLSPLVVRTRSDRPLLLETPRMFTPGYRASVNGSPARISASPDRLLAVAVPAGENTVDVGYRAPWPLALAYGTTCAGWLTLVLLGTAAATRRRREGAT